MNSHPRIQLQSAACQDDALAELREILQVTRPDALSAEEQLRRPGTLRT